MNTLLLIILLLAALWLALKIFVFSVSVLVGFFELWYSLVGMLAYRFKPKPDPGRTERLL